MSRRLLLRCALCIGVFVEPAQAQVFEDPTLDPPGAIVRKSPPRKPVPPPPPGAGCALQMSMRSKQEGRTLTLVAEVTNRRSAPVSFALATTCSSGPVQFAGISAKRDFYGTCNQGACLTDEPAAYTLRPGERREVATIRVNLDGDTCNAPVPEGSHLITFKLNFRSPPLPVCGPQTLPFVNRKPPPRPRYEPSPL